MTIRKFENFNYSPPQEKTLKEYLHNKKFNSVEIESGELVWLLENWNQFVYLTVNTSKNSFTFSWKEINEVSNSIKDYSIKSIYFDWTKCIFKDNDDWWWFRNDKKVYKCDEFFGLKSLLDKLGFTKESEVI
jgi:hypothetical protein